jgi:hypothetical protein
MKKTILPAILFLIALGLYAQNEAPSAILAYVEDDTQIEVRTKENSPVAVSLGMELLAGDRVLTKNTPAELQLEPNGSIIKLSMNTEFTVEKLQSSDEGANRFSLLRGKIRTVAAKSGLGMHYEVATPSAVCGVRGTDFGVISIPEKGEEKAFVAQGEISYRRLDTGEAITLTSGMIADALSATFQAVQMTREQLNEVLKDLQFTRLDPATVPGHSSTESPALEEAEEKGEEEDTGEGDEQGGQEEAGESAKGTGLSPGLALAAQKAKASDAGRSGGEGPVARFFSNYLGFEIGTVTMEGKTYSKAVIKPHLEAGKLRLGLYLPIIYNDDLFDYDQWYRPAGNDEWSFGADQDWNGDPAGAAGDLLADIALKLHYLEWGDRRDPFYLKLGNLHNMGLGHGSLMKNYANDIEFPTIRRVGLNMGVKGGKSGFETVVNDLAEPEIFGGRLFFSPIGRLTFGISSVADINPLSAADPIYVDTQGLDSMSFITGGVDTELAIFEGDILSIVPFADAAVMMPERNGEYYYDMVYDDSQDLPGNSFRNYGLSAGILGNIFMVDYTLEYRYTDGLFHHSFFGPNYERVRGLRVTEVNDYLTAMETGGATVYDELTMGIYGDASAALFDMFAFSAGYMWPWKGVDSENPETFGDEFAASFTILPDVIPVVGIHGGIYYYRTNFVPMITTDEMSFFDAYAVFKGEIVYPIAPVIDLAAVFSTAVRHDEDGNIVYKNDKPEMVPNITIETRVSF